ncbi:FAD-dependent monooxygenase [uncultured Mucilaginibacter sp.]|uniref:FAD-dependent monooxygenase n=1 Tax=uncultured Mucilaginibacter sp. TaxID=797541 RepID=UPI0025EC586D|nr:FAD-dependent monooxygenase [uncultured Mucilaginibacter sp.]
MAPIPPSPVKVLIIGAGPSGLMMAAQLLRYGIQPVIVDSRQGPTQYSKALAVQARSLEIYRQLGIVDAVLKGGKRAEGFNFHYLGKPKGTFKVAESGVGQTPYPFIHIYEQHKNERVLLDYLTLNSCPVYWNTTLTALQQGTGVVSARLTNQTEEYSIVADYLIGADGAHSAVRRWQHVHFNGDTYNSRYYLADVVLENSGDDMNMYLTAQGFAAFFPMPGTGAWRIVGNLPDKLINTDNLTIDHVLPALREKLRKQLVIKECRWFTTYGLHHRMADKFKIGRCFLIGDAAHIHSPVGGQGMNTGIQDAYNLAWKLAGVIKGHLKADVLNSYAAERMPVASRLLKTTDRAFKVIMSRGVVARLIKRFALPALMNWVWKREKFKFEAFKTLSQTGISYQNSELSLHLSQLQTVKAGDRLPFLKIFDEKKMQETDLHAWCSKPGFTLITMGPLQELYLFSLAKWITQNYNGWLNFFHLPTSVKNQHVYDYFDIKEHQNKTIIVRPDMHIGLINDIVDLEMMKNYLENVAGCIANNTGGGVS